MKTRLLTILILLLVLVPSAWASTRPVSTHDSARSGVLRDDLQSLLRAAFNAYRQKKYPEALEYCEKAINKEPNDHRAYIIKGLVFMAQWKMKEASVLFAKSISLKADEKESYFFKATADRYSNDFDAAVEACRKALEIDPEYAKAYALIGEILRNKKERRAEAVEAYRSAIKFDPGFLKAYVELGQTFGYQKDFEAAEEILREALSKDPKKMAGRFELGRILVRQNRLEEARGLWEGRASDEDRTIPNFITMLERAEKLEGSKVAVEKNPDDPQANLEMGIAVMEGDHWVVDGRQKRALVYFEKALELKPGFVEAQFQICKAWVQIADTYEKENSNVDRELAKLRLLDPKRADEMEKYRMSFSGGIKLAVPPKI